MACYHPVRGWLSKVVNPSGKRSIVYNRKESLGDEFEVIHPCGQCIGCRLARSSAWATRCMHEASLYENNCFITLTYSPESCPKDMSLRVKHFQDFMKRLRKKYVPVCPYDKDDPNRAAWLKKHQIRYYMCGEYGDLTNRPHYHAILFNHEFSDKYHFKNSKTGFPVYRSPSLEKLWDYGMSEIGSVTFESAAYVARYIMKKVTGDAADFHYEYLNPDTGEISWRIPEYTTMSRRPGIAKEWYDKFYKDVYPGDFIVITRGDKVVKVKPPKYYDTQYELLYPEEYALLRLQRKKNAAKFTDNNTPDRLAVREIVQSKRLELLPRPLD